MKIYNTWVCKVEDQVIEPLFCDLLIEEGVIKKLIPAKFDSFIKGRRKVKEGEFNALGRVVTIPLVNFHDHIYSRLAKGVPIKGKTDNFQNILKNVWWKIDRLLDADMIKASAEMTAMESIKHGVTYIFDHHSSPNYAQNSLRYIAKVLRVNEIRSVLAFETTDRNGRVLSKKSLNANKSFYHNFTGADLKSMFGLHASFTLNDSTLQDVSRFINENNLGIHIHLCEDPLDRKTSKSKHKKPPIDRLGYFGLLNDKSILSHAIHLTKTEYKKISNNGSAIALNIDSNLNNSVGIPKFDQMKEIPLLAGTDGMHANPGRTIKNTFLLSRHIGFSFDESFELIKKIYFDQIRFIKKYFFYYPHLNKGDRADLIIWDYVPPTPITKDNFWGHFIYGMLESNIHSTIQKGNVLMREGKLQSINEEKTYRNIYKQGEKLYSKMKRMKK